MTHVRLALVAALLALLVVPASASALTRGQAQVMVATKAKRMYPRQTRRYLTVECRRYTRTFFACTYSAGIDQYASGCTGGPFVCPLGYEGDARVRGYRYGWLTTVYRPRYYYL